MDRRDDKRAEIITRLRNVLRANGGHFPTLRCVANDRLIPRGSWRLLLGAKTWDVRYCTITSAGYPIRHLSPYSQIHYSFSEALGMMREDTSAHALCGAVFTEGRTFFDDCDIGTEVCRRCQEIADAQDLVVLDEIPWTAQGSPK